MTPVSVDAARRGDDGDGEVGGPVLRVEHLVRRFGDRVAVDDVSFTIGPGEVYGLLGPNGAGKTTAISMVCGLLRPHGGRVTVCGEEAGPTQVATKRLVGYVPQELAVYPDLTARENLRFVGRLYGLRAGALAGRIEEVLDTVDLAERADDRVEEFSGGMKRRLNIAAGLLHRPELLVLDEPTVGVDPQSRNAILDSAHRLGTAGMAVLYTTHYMEEAERLCDRVGIIDKGRLVAEGTRRELVSMVGEHDRIEVGANGDLDALARACEEVAGVLGVTRVDGALHVVADEGRRLLPRVLEVSERVGVEVTSIEVAEPDLETVFLHLTGTALRD
jgi:ABC-2 type transport system ATP-binding protein